MPRRHEPGPTQYNHVLLTVSSQSFGTFKWQTLGSVSKLGVLSTAKKKRKKNLVFFQDSNSILK